MADSLSNEQRNLTAATATNYAGRVRASREIFAKAFDNVSAIAVPDAYIDFKMIALACADDRSAYSAAFQKAAKLGFLNQLVAHLTQLRYLDLTDLLTAAANGAQPDAAGLGLTPQDATTAILYPQGWTPEMIGMVDIAYMIPGLLIASSRVCMVCVDGEALGTGFLVGPQTILTNWHVAHSLIDPQTGNALASSSGRLSCDFDVIGVHQRSSHPAVDDWLVDWSPMNVTANAVAGDYPDMTGLKPGKALDFCVIRVAGAPGRMRGWYDLTTAPNIPSGMAPFFVVQHPQQFSQRIAVTTNVKTAQGNPDQIQHMAPTLGGSSGGLCLDSKFRVVGLHQGELKQQQVLVCNLAIAAKAIAGACQNLADVAPDCDAIWLLQRSRKAVIGRAATIARINSMKTPKAAKPVLIVRGESDSGKSFTADLIEDRIVHDERVIVLLDASTLPSDARDLAILILSKAGVAQERCDTLSKRDAATTTDIAWIKNQLIADFRKCIVELPATTASGKARTFWIVLDNLDTVDITQTSARSFLDALYEALPGMPQLRIILIGLNGGLPAGDPQAADFEELPDPENPDPGELRNFLGYVLTERRIAYQLDELDRLTDLAISMANSLSKTGEKRSKLARISTVFSDIVYITAQKWKQT